MSLMLEIAAYPYAQLGTHWFWQKCAGFSFDTIDLRKEFRRHRHPLLYWGNFL